MEELTEYFWRDSKVVLGYIDENKKVTIKVANENLYKLDISQIKQAEGCIIKLV